MGQNERRIKEQKENLSNAQSPMQIGGRNEEKKNIEISTPQKKNTKNEEECQQSERMKKYKKEQYEVRVI